MHVQISTMMVTTACFQWVFLMLCVASELASICLGTYHLGCRVEDLHLFQDGGPVVGDGHVTLPILDLQKLGSSLAACT